MPRKRDLRIAADRLERNLQRQADLRRKFAAGLISQVLSRLKGERAAWDKELAGLSSGTEELRLVVRRMGVKVGKLDRIVAALERSTRGRLEAIRNTSSESERLNAILGGLNLLDPEPTTVAVAELVAKTNAYRERTGAIAAEYKTLTKDQIQQRLQDVNQRIERLRTLALLERVREAVVIGMTLDCHIGRFLEESIPFDHAFLDEAGYAPVVKALTLLRRGVPCTFLGDHMQLGPVCELDEETQGRSVMVWNKSALFVDDLFVAESRNTLIDDWCRSREPRLRSFARANLRRTFRFGQNMARLLAELVYKGFHLVSAVPSEGLRITCVDAPLGEPPNRKRENAAEAECIQQLLANHSGFSEGGGASKWVILTPYLNQVELLGRYVRKEGEERILPIHKSQGREWDTVILSVVDGPSAFNSPWFTNTRLRKSNGMRVMNTAITRARKHLILVCDVAFWRCQKGRELQLISRLVEMASDGGSVTVNETGSAAQEGDVGLRVPGELGLG